MAKKYILLGGLSIASKLLDFVNNELLPGTSVSKENFCLFSLNSQFLIKKLNIL